ncbi:hypothetical protein [Pseudomonas izuensis]|nr:hypothetical protein [Pseudomonas izuensis]
MDVNDDEVSQDERGGALTSIASKLAPTQGKKKATGLGGFFAFVR